MAGEAPGGKPNRCGWIQELSNHSVRAAIYQQQPGPTKLLLANPAVQFDVAVRELFPLFCEREVCEFTVIAGKRKVSECVDQLTLDALGLVA